MDFVGLPPAPEDSWGGGRSLPEDTPRSAPASSSPEPPGDRPPGASSEPSPKRLRGAPAISSCQPSPPSLLSPRKDFYPPEDILVLPSRRRAFSFSGRGEFNPPRRAAEETFAAFFSQGTPSLPCPRRWFLGYTPGIFFLSGLYEFFRLALLRAPEVCFYDLKF